MNASTGEKATTGRTKRRHHSVKLQPAAKRGRASYALCLTKAKPVEVFDQAFGDGLGKKRTTVIAELPLRGRCARAVARRAGDAS